MEKRDSVGETSGGDCPSHLMERWSGTGAGVIRLCFPSMCAHTHIHTHTNAKLSAHTPNRPAD